MNLGFSHDMTFASVAGTGEILHDRDKLEQLWGIGTQAWSDKDETPQNTSKVVLVVHGETAQYWNAPSKPASRACSPMRSRPAKAALRSCDSYSGQS